MRQKAINVRELGPECQSPCQCIALAAIMTCKRPERRADTEPLTNC